MNKSIYVVSLGSSFILIFTYSREMIMKKLFQHQSKSPTAALIALPLLLGSQSLADGIPCRAQSFLGADSQLSLARNVVTQGSTAYLTTYNGFFAYDISDPANPQQLGSYNSLENLYNLVVQGTTAYVAAGLDGLYIFDVSNPTMPTLLGTYDSDFASYVQVSGDYAYLSDSELSLLVIDISNPASPSLVDTYVATGDPRDIHIDGTTAYAVYSGVGLVTLDISNPASIQQIGTYSMSPSLSGSLLDIEVEGSTAYVAGGGHGLHIFDVSNLAAPSLTSSYFTSEVAQRVSIQNSLAYVANSLTGIQVIDVSTPASPTLHGYIDDTLVNAQDITLVGDVAYIADRENGLQVYNTTNIGTPLIATQDTPDVARGVAVSGSTAYVADFESGVQFYDITDPANPTPIGSYAGLEYANGIAANGDTLYVATNNDGFFVIDASDPSNPALLGSIPGSTLPLLVDVTLEGNIAHVQTVGSNGSFHSIDISDPMNPTLLRTTYFSTNTRDFVAEGTTAYLAAGSDGLHIVDTSNPGWDVFLGTYTLSNPSHRAAGIAVDGDIAYLSYDRSSQFDSGLFILDISDPTNPQELGSIETEGDALNVEVIGTNVCVAFDASYTNGQNEYVRVGGIQVIDASDPTAPTMLGTWDQAGDTKRVSLSGTTACLSNGQFGFQMIDVSDCSVTSCPADFTQEGDLNFLDISAFLSAYSMQEPAADFNTDGNFNFLDISEFLSAFADGCP